MDKSVDVAIIGAGTAGLSALREVSKVTTVITVSGKNFTALIDALKWQ